MTVNKQKRTLIRGGSILSNDKAIGELRIGDVLMQGTKIEAVAPRIEADDAEVVDATNMIVMPGLVDSHRHTWQTLLRAAGTDWTLGQYFTGMRLIAGRLLSADDMYLSNYLGALEAMNSGITTLYDWCHNNNTPDHAEQAFLGLRDAGIRGVWGYGNANDDNLPPNMTITDLNDVRRMKTRYFSSSDQLLTMAFAARGPEITTLEITEREFHFVRDLGLRITMHVGVGSWHVDPMKQLHRRGLLSNDTTYVHCNMLSRDEMQLIIDTGGTTSISPETELNMGLGDLATLRLLALGHRPSISTDEASSAPGDMFSSMRTVLTMARAEAAREALAQGRELEPIPLTSRDVFEFSTLEGAKACGYDGLIGSLTPGKQADVVLIDTNAVNLMPLNYTYGSIIESTHAGNIDSVYVAGKAMKRGGKLLSVDLASLRKKVDAARDGLFSRAGVPHDQHWMPKPYLRKQVVDAA
ncbi:amidohydrolase family protein [Cupriavidus sp. 2TAF22]|uniref:amidohydrolase family protein n=1 Tax=unclassified Cupriavidus TaxID=2640874 RepID=UPI003F8EA593